MALNTAEVMCDFQGYVIKSTAASALVYQIDHLLQDKPVVIQWGGYSSHPLERSMCGQQPLPAHWTCERATLKEVSPAPKSLQKTTSLANI